MCDASHADNFKHVFNYLLNNNPSFVINKDQIGGSEINNNPIIDKNNSIIDEKIDYKDLCFSIAKDDLNLILLDDNNHINDYKYDLNIFEDILICKVIKMYKSISKFKKEDSQFQKEIELINKYIDKKTRLL
jgi:hypothetical protein